MQVVVVGSYIQDLAFNTPSFPAPGETRIGRFQMGPGGKGFNQAVAAHRQGAKTLFIGAVGEDLFAEGVRTFARQEGLRIELETGRESTGAASIVVNEQGENLIVVALGASGELSAGHVQKFATEIEQAEVVICQAECNLAAVEAAFKSARAAGVTTLLNPAPINDDITSSILQLADILVPNETEFRFLQSHLLGKKLSEDYWTRSPEELHQLCRDFDVQTVVLTLGAKGCLVSTAEGFQSYSAAEVNAIDTTGAGDAFCGGLGASLCLESDFEKAVRRATVVAGLSTQRPGTSPAMPSAEEVIAFMES